MNYPINKLKTNRTCFKRLHIIVFCCMIVCSLVIFVAFNFLVHQLDHKLHNSIEGRHPYLKFQLRKRNSKDSGEVLQKLHVSMQEMERKHHQPRSKPNKKPHTHKIRVVAPNKSTLTFPRYSRKSLGPVIDLQPELSSVKGRFVNYSHNYSTAQTSGNVFVYNHSYADPCYVHHISLKYSPECGDAAMNASFVRQVLVTAVQRSGTHFTWEMLNQLGVKVHHEGVGPMGAVGWLYAINAMIPAAKSTNISLDLSASAYKKEHKEQRERKEQQKDKQKEGRKDNVISFHRGYIINNPEKLTKHRFRHVFHQVRHPLRVITTLVQRCNSWDRFWNWIGKTRLRGFSEIHSNATALSRAMNLYYLWNRHIETYADIRFQSETTSPRDICRWARFNDSYCDSGKILASEMSEPILLPAAGAQNDTSNISTNSSNSSDRRDSFGVSNGSSVSGVSGVSGVGGSEGLRVARQLASVSNDSSSDVTLRSTRQSLSATSNESSSLNFASDSASISASNSGVVGDRAGSNSTGNNSVDVSASNSAGNSSASAGISDVTDSNVTTIAPKVTWEMLDTENSTLSSQLKAMCVEYGFPLDPDLVPQSAQSFQFKA